MRGSRIILTVSLLYTVFFLTYVVMEYGWLSSISKSAKYLQKDNLEILFATFICLLSFAFIVNAKSWMVGFGAPILAIIATYTGYSENIPSGLENTIHVVCTNIGILTMLAELLRQGILRYQKDKKTSYMSFIAFLGMVLPSLYMLATKMHNHTYWIEVDIIFFAYLYYFIKPQKNGITD